MPGGALGYGYTFPSSVAIEFDTYRDTQYDDPSSPHVGIDLNGNLISVVTSTANAFSNGNVWYAWVNYVGTSQFLQVFVSSSSTKPSTPTLQYPINLYTTLGSSPTMYVGFGAGSGGLTEEPYVHSWEIVISTFITGGNAVMSSAGTLGLISGTNQAGTSFYSTPVTFYEEGSLLNFTSFFSFAINCPTGSGCGNGMSFIVSLSIHSFAAVWHLSF